MKTKQLTLIEFESRGELLFIIKCIELTIKELNETTFDDEQDKEGRDYFLEVAEQMLNFWRGKLFEYDQMNTKEAVNGTSN